MPGRGRRRDHKNFFAIADIAAAQSIPGTLQSLAFYFAEISGFATLRPHPDE